MIEGEDTSDCNIVSLKIVQDHQSVQEVCRALIQERAARYEDTGDGIVGQKLL